MKNYYTDKLIVQYKRTTVSMLDVIAYLDDLSINVEVKRAAYIIFRIESANGKSGVNNNYVGMQADSARWPAKYDKLISGIVKLKENNGKIRLFCALTSWTACVDFLTDRITARGLYVGGTTHLVINMRIDNATDWAIGYKREWVTGIATYQPSQDEINSILSMYSQAEKLFI